MKSDRPGKLVILGLIAVMAVQCLFSVYWIRQKQNWFVDELYSFRYANAFSVTTPPAVHYPRMEGWTSGTWLDAEELQDFLVVTEEESLLSDSPGDVFRAMFYGRNYMGILNVAESIFSPGRMSPWIGLVINMFFFVPGQFLLFFLMKGLRMKNACAFLAVVMYTFAAGTLSQMIFVRFYMLVSFLLICVFFLHWKIWSGKSIPKQLLFEAVSLILLYFAFRNSELTAVIGGTLVLAFSAALLLRKRFVNFLIYFVPLMSAGIIFLSRKTIYLRALFHPEQYSDAGMAILSDMTRSVMDMTPEIFRANLWRFLDQFRLIFFNSRPTARLFPVLLAAAVIGAAVGYARHGKIQGGESEEDAGRKTETGCREELRYREPWAFAAVLGAVAAAYAVFLAFNGLDEHRYRFLVMVPVTVLIWFVLDRAMDYWKRPQIITAAAVALIAVQAVLPFRTRWINFLFEYQRELTEDLRSMSDTDAVICDADERNISRIYDCIVNTGRDARICPLYGENEGFDWETCPENVLVWVRHGADIGMFTSLFPDGGCQAALLGQDYLSDIYICVRTLE